jgi:hypothetical protein
MIRTSLRFFLAAIAICLPSLSVFAASAPNQVWQFDNNLNGEILTGSTAVVNGAWVPSYTTNPVGLPGATVINMQDFPAAESLLINNNIGANGGGLYTNNWTIMMDIMIPDTNPDYTSILNSSPTNSNDVDIYTGNGGSNYVDTWDGYTSNGVFSAGTWYRWTFRREAGVGMQFYQNGVLVPFSTDFGSALDGHMSFDPVFHLFGDDNGQNNNKFVNSVAYWGTPLSAAEISMFGGPSAAGIAVPEPGTMSLICISGIALVGLSTRRRMQTR